jgi:choline dehydrogenase-like flavoprotein
MPERCDVLIVGAGASAGVAALRLRRAGMSVVVLEQGTWVDRRDYRGAEPDWELTARKQWCPDPNIRRLPSDYPIDVADADIGISNFNGVGGGMILYGAIWPRMTPDDFRSRTTSGVGDDWPLSYQELQPYYEEADRQLGVSGLGGNPAYPPGADPPLPPLPLTPGAMLVARAFARMRWHWWPDSNAILSAPYQGRNVCVQRGSCVQGCGEGAKASTDLTHWPGFVAEGGTLTTGARVTRIVLDERGLARGAEWVDSSGTSRFQEADVVICAANGVGTPRLLLASASRAFPDGLANRSGLVGRRLMLHGMMHVVGLFEHDLRSWHGHAGGTLQSMQFYRHDEGRGFARGARWCLEPTGGPLGSALNRGRVFGLNHHQHVREHFGRSAMWNIVCEDLPDEGNRVELSDSLVDSTGLPGVKVTYRLGENTSAMQRWHTTRASEALLEAGAWRSEVGTQPRSGHQLGTTRMGRDPRSSVVDAYCVSHDVPNLLIIDGGVFVTSGGVNPTSTICALALRAAEHLVSIRSDIPVPAHPRSIPVPALRAPADPPADAAGKADDRSAGAAELSAAQRGRLAAIGDVLIPATAGMPSASQAGLGDLLIDRVLRSRPDLRSDIGRALRKTAASESSLERLAVTDPGAHEALVLAVVSGYYMSATVRERLGYPGQIARPVSSGAYPQYIAEGLLDFLLEPGPPESGEPETPVPASPLNSAGER